MATKSVWPGQKPPYDGYRIVAQKDGAIVRLWSRNGINWAHQFPMIVDAMRRLPVERVVLDGEAVCLKPDGHPEFRALQSRQTRATYA